MEKLIELRKQNKTTQNEIAKYLNIARTTYASYEQKLSEPDIKTLCQIADYYNVSLDYLCNHQRNEIDISYYSSIAKELIKKLPLLNNSNLIKLDSVCDGLLLAQ